MPTRATARYVGRFAPSPTGPLHFGSLVAAVASYLQARTNRGRWLLRIEDIDPPRAQAGASETIVRALQHYGFEWDGEIILQSASAAAHEQALQQLIDLGHAYPCGCSRRQLADVPRGALGPIYPGTCRDGCEQHDTAIRVRTDDHGIEFDDGLQGMHAQRLESESGDFVIRRRDGLIAYQLAVVVDDQLEGITEVVRGIDLIDSTPRQIWLQRLLGYPTPQYVHIPVVTHQNGDKLSKLTGAPGIPWDNAPTVLVAALRALQQDPPKALTKSTLAEIWNWAMQNWSLDGMQAMTAVQYTECLDINPSDSLA
ncbi:MAG: tRNA glutamyl-Q(34) synthetase GluQRS [Woeseiaceae bacterium]